ncbi:MAG: hypothetical protein C0434_16370 [Xanthomonadaceae bacterium]|nr:hypothetical protein [Xanthomonadaceae bacterium]
MERREGLTATELLALGVCIDEGNNKVLDFRFERPAMIHGHRLKGCSMGAYGFYNAAGLASAYRTHFGRYSQVGESTIVGPPEHPMTMFSTHPFAFSRPSHMPKMFQMPEFARISPEEADGPSWAESETPIDTVIGHEAYVGAGSFVRRGVTVGIGAVIGARSVVTRDVPPYAIVAGSPARVLRYRYPDALIERFLKLAWWNYDLGPIKRDVNWADSERSLEFLEQKAADGTLQKLVPEAYSVTSTGSGYSLTKLATPLY